jgi:hypothetical protein
MKACTQCGELFEAKRADARFCSTKCRTNWWNNATQEEKERARAVETPRKSRKKLKPLESYPNMFMEIFLPLARGERRVSGDQLTATVKEFRVAHRRYILWEEFTEMLWRHADNARLMGRASLSEELERDARAASGWKLQARTIRGKAKPQETEEWGLEGTITFCRRYGGEEDRALEEAFLRQLEGEQKSARGEPSADLNELFFNDED